jgi:hypothetical protein
MHTHNIRTHTTYAHTHTTYAHITLTHTHSNGMIGRNPMDRGRHTCTHTNTHIHTYGHTHTHTHIHTHTRTHTHANATQINLGPLPGLLSFPDSEASPPSPSASEAKQQPSRSITFMTGHQRNADRGTPVPARGSRTSISNAAQGLQLW